MKPFDQRRRTALLQRIDDLLVNPSAVPLIDHYVDQLIDAGPVPPFPRLPFSERIPA